MFSFVQTRKLTLRDFITCPVSRRMGKLFLERVRL